MGEAVAALAEDADPVEHASYLLPSPLVAVDDAVRDYAAARPRPGGRRSVRRSSG